MLGLLNFALADDPFEQAIEGMRDAQQRIGKGDTGEETRAIQTQVIKNLDQLIEMAKRRPPPAGSPPNSQQQPSQAQSEPQKQQQSGEENAQPQDGGGGAVHSENDQAGESTEETRAAEQRGADAARRQEMVHDVWGHLPPAMRQKLLNVFSEKYLQKYQEEVERYFESLAEEGRAKP